MFILFGHGWVESWAGNVRLQIKMGPSGGRKLYGSARRDFSLIMSPAISGSASGFLWSNLPFKFFGVAECP